MAKISNPRDIIIAPVVSEKSYGLMEQNVYTFYVSTDSNKSQIKDAVEQIFGVKVDSVNTVNRAGKRKRTRTGYGQRKLSLIHISEPTRLIIRSRMPSSA